MVCVVLVPFCLWNDFTIFVFCREYKETALHIVLLIININYYDDNKIIQIEILNVFNTKILL